ncbi:PREDICTED: uncharacterized protein LOC104605072 [Nelumbo nucifera]|uniref:Uncharacterized protein LOC104605072 n=2 Tax=Nelumbo nucifera TaxID=4432 RepID=A0A1U8AP76_NELNU|nr:PREDICTED: uncharacterized protein LOC104605072 [Nelumbo nucifera]DAD33121.1 TPA_asm: hypothetical protein HUJ06_011972 [Nelumbo nucifera]
MGSEKWKKMSEKLNFDALSILAEPFYIFTHTILSLLLPLSFLLLARLSTGQHIPSFTSSPTSTLSSLFLYAINPLLVQFLVSVVSVSALVHGLTGRFPSLSESVSRPRLYAAWVLLCSLQVCVGLGLEETIVAGFWAVDYGNRTPLIRRLVFFLGLYQTMLHWSRTVVKPVVDDTVFGFERDERWVERVAVGGCFGGLWWWKLRAEVEALALVVEVKRELLMDVGNAEIFGLWLYYMTVTVGWVRLVKGLIRLVDGAALLWPRPKPSNDCSCVDDAQV